MDSLQAALWRATLEDDENVIPGGLGNYFMVPVDL